jgi:hypothetical protein
MQLKSITAITVLLVMVTSLLVAGCTTTNQTTTFTSNRGYTITYPSAWEKDVNNDTTAPIDLYLFPNPNKIDGVVVASTNLNATTGTTLQTFTDYNLNSLATYSGYTLQSFENTTFAGQPAKKIVWQATLPEQIGNATQNAQIKGTQVFVIYKGSGYIISYKATTSDYDTYLTQAQGAINSFKFAS